MEARDILEKNQKSKFKAQNVGWNKIVPVLLIVATAAAMRILPHPPNMAPIGGLALFSGARLGTVAAFGIPLTAMLISDAFLGFHRSMPFVYASFILIVFLGKLLKGRTHAGKLAIGALASSTLFFVITNFGVWITGTMYPTTLEGLVNAYILGIPFFRNTLAGDLVYSFGFFYGYDFVKKYIMSARSMFVQNKG